MKKITLLLAGSVLLLSGCAGVKSSFDCDVTTSDTCMTMTKANQLARDKVAKQTGKQAAGGLPPLVSLPMTETAPARSVSNVPAVSPAGASASVVQPASGAVVSRAQVSVPASSGSLLAPRLVTGTPVVTAKVRPVSSTPSCQTVRCDSPGSVHPQRSQDRIATVWIAPWVDSDNAFHQPGRVSFVADPADWVLPSRVN